MVTHRVRRRPITRSDGEEYEPGDELEPTEAELEAFGDNLEEIEDEADTDTDADEETKEGDVGSDGDVAELSAPDDLSDASDESELADVLDGTVDEIETALATGTYDDVLNELEALEEDGEGRKGVFTSINDRRTEGGE